MPSAQDYAEAQPSAREGQAMALRNIRIEVRDDPDDDDGLIFWVEGYAFWKASEQRWNERLKALGEQL